MTYACVCVLRPALKGSLFCACNTNAKPYHTRHTVQHNIQHEAQQHKKHKKTSQHQRTLTTTQNTSCDTPLVRTMLGKWTTSQSRFACAPACGATLTVDTYSIDECAVGADMTCCYNIPHSISFACYSRNIACTYTNIHTENIINQKVKQSSWSTQYATWSSSHSTHPLAQSVWSNC